MFIRLRAIYNGGVDLDLKMLCDAFTGSDIMSFVATVATGASFLVLFLLIIASYTIAIGIFCALLLYLPCSVRTARSIMSPCPTITASYGANVFAVLVSVIRHLVPLSFFERAPIIARSVAVVK